MSKLPYDPSAFPRESHRHYLPASEAELQAMLQRLNLSSLDELFAHVPEEVRFAKAPDLPDELGYEETAAHVEAISQRNRPLPGFLGDGLPHFSVSPIVPYVLGLRKLATAYTPYQPERSQGTLICHWIYQCALTSLTGFEAINSSLYDRASGIYEALATALRMQRKADIAIVCDGLYPADLETVETLIADTEFSLERVPLDPTTGRISLTALRRKAEELGSRVGAIVFPQVNTLGLLEDVDALTDLCAELGVQSVAVVDPMLLGPDGLKEPAAYGQNGANMIVGEAQHLAIGPNFGGPGLGLFGVRYNDANKNAIRYTPGRYVGKALDGAGRDCRVMVLSTREQHIRKEKATSNICSNQAFLATLAGSALLERGAEGIGTMLRQARATAVELFEQLTRFEGVRPAFEEAPFFNELTLEVPEPVDELLADARKAGLHLGVDVSDRIGGGKRPLLKLSTSDRQDADVVAQTVAFFAERYGEPTQPAAHLPKVPAPLQRKQTPNLPRYSQEKLQDYYNQLAELNVSPDDGIYPLGSCTMKYNPYLNEWAAALPGFADLHPQTPIEDAQGALEVLWESQEWFRKITGLAAVTTQPVAGAQGELVGIKLFQAYHRSRGEHHRKVLLIPASAHGTNFATASMAGCTLALLKGGDNGLIDEADLDAQLAKHGANLAGIMVTNPNTTGLFERDFKRIADKVHAAGGLVYMDGANMNAIAGWVDLGALGVDAVHNNLHKTWSIPHGGGGPGDGFVAVSARLQDFLPGYQIEKRGGRFEPVRPLHSIGRFHRHWGNFGHKVRAYTYLSRLGKEGVRRMSAVAVLAARYCLASAKERFPLLPAGSDEKRMHEFIMTLSKADFERLEAAGVPHAAVIARIGKLFLDFGYHAPTVAWPETYGVMIEPTESYTQAELDRFNEAVLAIGEIVTEHPEVLQVVPLFMPTERIDEVAANRNLVLNAPLDELPPIHPTPVPAQELLDMDVQALKARIVAAAQQKLAAQA
ncbi:MAG: aminomethyl-transferring glycine dehydrogenase subunit GcvPB [Verrucomicrobiota bacterium JB022]|nr:aminomethyl-transferring glycine dehydrogenase subunit GcvPB [Verrucomicrobiota bacterium JB022]